MGNRIHSRWHAEPAQKTSPGWIDPEGVRTERYGLSVWDAYAIAALQTMRIDTYTDNPLYWQGVAKSVAEAADAMMAERDKRRSSV